MIKTYHTKGRTLEENAYYHGVVVKYIAQYKNWSSNKAHQWVKDTFGIESTSCLTTIEFEELMEAVRTHVKKYWKLIINLPE